MPKHLLIFLIVCALTAVARAQETKQMTVDQLVAKNIEAKGGAKALQALQSVKFTGKQLVRGGSLELGYTQIKKRPASVRTEVTLQGMTAVEAFDGKDGWQISPFRGRKDPEKMSADDTKSLAEEAEIGGPLVNWKEKGSTVEYLGTEDVEGTAAHKLKVTRKNGDISYVYLDPDYFLEIRIVTQRMEHGALVETETDLSDYEKVNDVFLPLSKDTGSKRSSEKAKVILDQAEGNIPVDDKIFQFPTASAK